MLTNPVPAPLRGRPHERAARLLPPAGQNLRAARAAHYWEEPVISGSFGSGAVFFLRLYAQMPVLPERRHFAGKPRKRNFNRPSSGNLLKTHRRWRPEHQSRHADALSSVHSPGADSEAPVPVVYNCGGYERVETLRELEGLVDIYLPDMKYSDPKLAGILSAAPDYVEIAKAAIAEMYRQVGSAVIEDEIMQRGMIVRHLMLPGELDNTLGVLDWFSEAFPKGDVLFSLMSQYVPMGKAKTMPPYDRRITEDEYDAALSYLELLGIENGFTQDFSAATEEYIPDFSFEGL